MDNPENPQQSYKMGDESIDHDYWCETRKFYPQARIISLETRQSLVSDPRVKFSCPKTNTYEHDEGYLILGSYAVYQVSMISAIRFQRRFFQRFLPYMDMVAILVMRPQRLR